MSGGRATIKRGEVRQAGDITAVSPEGHSLTDRYYIECKAYRNLQVEAFLVTGRGALAKFWEVTCREASSHRRDPMLIAKQNNMPILMLTKEWEPRAIPLMRGIVNTPSGYCVVRHFDEVMDTLYRSGGKK